MTSHIHTHALTCTGTNEVKHSPYQDQGVQTYKENRVIVRTAGANVHVVGCMAQLETVNDIHIVLSELWSSLLTIEWCACIWGWGSLYANGVVCKAGQTSLVVPFLLE